MTATIFPFQPPANTPAPAESASITTLHDRRMNAANLYGVEVPERRWHVPGLIPAANVTLLAGDGGTGKSLLAQQLADATVTGGTWLGRPVQQGAVEFLSAEDSLDELHRRQADIVRHAGGAFDDRVELHLTSLADHDAILAAPADGRGGALVETALYREVDSILDMSWPVLLIVDTLADTFGGDEIKRAHARQFIGLLRGLALRHDTTILVLYHFSVAGMNSGTGTSGSTAWSNSVRSRLYFDRMRDSDGSEPDSDVRVLRTMKANYGRTGETIQVRWRDGVFVVEGSEAGGDPMIARAKAERVFLTLLSKYNFQGRSVSASTGHGYAPKVFQAEAAKQGISKRALADAMERLLDSGRIVVETYGPPSRQARRLVASTPISAPQGESE